MQSLSQVAESNCVGTALIVTSNRKTAGLLSECLNHVAIATDVCMNSADCLKTISRRKFEAVLIDFALGKDAFHVLEDVRSTTSTRSSVVIAITPNDKESKEAFSAGAHFVVQQPLTKWGVDSVLKAAYGLIIRERRRYFRCPIEVDVTCQRQAEPPWTARVINISEGGFCMKSPEILIPGELIQIEIRLPSPLVQIKAECEVLWLDSEMRVGVKFARLNETVMADLQHWLADRLEARLMGSSPGAPQFMFDPH
jgi:DNA-binding response OmpR family regulator